jgi:hypothetical protein
MIGEQRQTLHIWMNLIRRGDTFYNKKMDDKQYMEIDNTTEGGCRCVQ